MNPGIIPKSYEDLEEGQLLDYNGAIFNKHLTTFCRNDLNWSDFGKYLKEKFESPKDVNFHVFGCSIGNEPYSLALLLNRVYDTTDFEIDASDIADYIIENNLNEQKFGAIVEPFDYFKICRDLNLDFKHKEKYFLNPEGSYPIIRPEIANTVKFRKANILNEVDNLDSSKPSVIFCRNMWPYIDSHKYQEFAQKLYEKLPEGSMVVIGDFDYIGDYQQYGSETFPLFLEESGFKRSQRGKSRLRAVDNKNYTAVYVK